MTAGSEHVFAFVAWTVAALVVILGVTALSRRIGWSAPLVLVAIGIGAEFIPWVPRVTIDPEIVLIGVLPALLFASALRTSFLEVRARGDSILVLSVGLVVFTAAVVGLVTWWLVPGITFAVGIAFGAIVAPTDAVSVAAIIGEGRMPRRLEALLESEGLLNDATALVTLNVAITAIDSQISVGGVALDFVIAVAAGAASGVVVSWVVTRVRRRLNAPVLDTSVSLVTPYLAYLPATAVQGSGFLAVAMTGIWLAYRSPAFQSAESRIAERINWRTVSFLLENGVFLLIGLQLPGIVTATLKTQIGVIPGILIIAGIYVAMVLARFAWVFAASLIYRVGPEWWQDRRFNRQTSVAISFAGVRGVVTLAAVFLLPTKELGPVVGFLQLAAFVVVVVSLLQGLAIGPLVRALKLPLPNPDQDRVQIRSLTAEAQAAAIRRLDREATPDDPPGLVDFLKVSAEYRQGIAQVRSDGMGYQEDAYARLRLLMLDSERRAVLDAQRDGRYEEDVIQAVLGDFDSIETALARSRRRDLPDAPTPRLMLPNLSLRRFLKAPPREE